MEYNSYLQNCGDDDVLSFDNAMLKVGKFKDAVEYAFTDPRYLQESLLFLSLVEDKMTLVIYEPSAVPVTSKKSINSIPVSAVTSVIEA